MLLALGLTLSLTLSFTLGLAPSVAHAHGGGSNDVPSASELPPGPIKKDLLGIRRRLQTEKLDEELLERPLAEVLRSVERTRGAKAAGDARHGAQLEQLANRWLKAARAVLKAVLAERRASRAATQLRDREQALDRAAALLSEQQARLGRLQAQVAAAEAAAKKRGLPREEGPADGRERGR
ncbi:MAG: hypothetical protein AAGN82_25020 [Myxococcota bacterium]